MRQYESFARGEVCATLDAAEAASFNALNTAIHYGERPPTEVLEAALDAQNIYRDLLGRPPLVIVEGYNEGEGGRALEQLTHIDGEEVEKAEPSDRARAYSRYRKGGYGGGEDDGEEG